MSLKLKTLRYHNEHRYGMSDTKFRGIILKNSKVGGGEGTLRAHLAFEGTKKSGP